MEGSQGVTGLGRALVQSRLLTREEAENIQRQAESSSVSFVEQLVLSRKKTAREIAEFAATLFGYPLFDLSAIEAESLPQGLIDESVMVSRRVLPLFKRGNRLFVAASDPTQTSAFHAITFKTGLTVDVVVVEEDKLARVFSRRMSPGAESQGMPEIGGFDELGASDVTEETVQQEVDDAPVVRLIHKLLLDAIKSGASDIHFEPYEKYYRVRYRIDGELRLVAQPPLVLKEKIASRIKVVSRLDIAEKRLPQDGRMKLSLSRDRAIDFRVSTLPTLFGEKIVMRILDAAAVSLDIDALGLNPIQKKLLTDAVARPWGMVLVTGPTGSGKTVSLYTCLAMLNTPDINISTAEDPVEINLPGVNQVNVNEKAGLTFASALRAFLRQDPDVIMVGEIRDFETADIAIKAAQTGHRVFSTLHTNDAPSTLTRLLNMGIAPFNVASSVSLIMAQRLARKLCPSCRTPLDLPRETLLEAGFTEDELDGGWQSYGPAGCPECKGTGYRGRVGLFEVMPMTDAMTRLIMRNGNAVEIADLARKEGMIDLRRAGLIKVRQGETSLAEIEAITSDGGRS
ncbi:type IV-A pilus assembly ATPase PilB [Paludibacterium paludis]|uniref:Type 4 fimbrial assembly protein PilB n=1 Tax=Paludibacterium paludis TaxID=1225769 RepID=A0A918NZL4_9NEIS|nr:type IV-A pilus assembly ATPase PilB [Paludibacterium paludis]GGY08213.1 type 4 fimbrial assembly protein PilB [Paludibacterium paludis]